MSVFIINKCMIFYVTQPIYWLEQNHCNLQAMQLQCAWEQPPLPPYQAEQPILLKQFSPRHSSQVCFRHGLQRMAFTRIQVLPNRCLVHAVSEPQTQTSVDQTDLVQNENNCFSGAQGSCLATLGIGTRCRQHTLTHTHTYTTGCPWLEYHSFRDVQHQCFFFQN